MKTAIVLSFMACNLTFGQLHNEPISSFYLKKAITCIFYQLPGKNTLFYIAITPGNKKANFFVNKITLLP